MKTHIFGKKFKAIIQRICSFIEVGAAIDGLNDPRSPAFGLVIVYLEADIVNLNFDKSREKKSLTFSDLLIGEPAADTFNADLRRSGVFGLLAIKVRNLKSFIGLGVPILD
jgi:hypothetical protein